MQTRRALLGGVAAAVLGGGLGAAGYGVEQGTLPGRPWLQRRLGLDGPDGVVPDATPGPVLTGSFVSAARGGVRTGWSLILPPGRRPRTSLPLVLALHPLGATAATLTGPSFGVDRFLAAHVRAGGPPFAIAAADGGTSYWHLHHGEDAGAMVTDELLPLVADHGIATSGRLGLMGWSMGGYGVLRLAGLLRARRVAAVSAASPALWAHGGDASANGFDDAEEYAAFTVFGHERDLRGVAVRIDCGTGDPFYRAVQDYADGCRDAGVDVSAHFDPGGHDSGYWRRMLPAELSFLGGHLVAA